MLKKVQAIKTEKAIFLVSLQFRKQMLLTNVILNFIDTNRTIPILI